MVAMAEKGAQFPSEWWRTAIAAALALAVLAGGPKLSQAATDQPQRGGTLVTALGSDPPTVNPDVTRGVPDTMIGCMVYPSLVRRDRHSVIRPFLATSWTVSPDGRTYTFQLADAKWQDGQPVTSADVQYTLLQVSAKYGPSFTTLGKDITAITTPNAHTVRITLARPSGPFLFSLSCANNTAILPAHVFKGTNALTNPATLSNPVSAGPFTLQEWVRGDHITMVRNPGYWKSGHPYLDKVIFRIIPQPSSIVLALKSGELDYVYFYYFPHNDYPTFQHDSRFQLQPAGVPEDTLIIFNVRRPPLNDRRVRQALFMALNRDYIAKAVFQGFGTVGRSAIDSRLTWAYNPDVNYETMYPYDPEKAKALLDGAGLKPGPGGSRFTMHLVYDSTRGGYTAFAQAVQHFWQAVGVQVVLDGAERAVELKRVYEDWDFDATLQAYSTAGDPALGIARLYVTSAIRKLPFVNCSGYSNPTVDALFDDAAFATTEARRAEDYRKVQTILARDLPTLVILQNENFDVAASRVQDGLWRGLQGYGWWDGVWLRTTK